MAYTPNKEPATNTTQQTASETIIMNTLNHITTPKNEADWKRVDDGGRGLVTKHTKN